LQQRVSQLAWRPVSQRFLPQVLLPMLRLVWQPVLPPLSQQVWRRPAWQQASQRRSSQQVLLLVSLLVSLLLWQQVWRLRFSPVQLCSRPVLQRLWQGWLSLLAWLQQVWLRWF
jgi:hypothetical protein